MSNSKNVLVTGTTGFLGRYIAREMHEANCRVFGIGTTSEENAPTDVLSKYFRVSLPGKNLAKLLADIQPAVIVHCAGRASVPFSVQNPMQDYQGNTLLCIEMLESIRKSCPDAKFLLLSSAAVYGNPSQLPVAEDCTAAPLSPYGYHKRQAELLCEEYWRVYGIRTIVLRIFSAFGPGLRRQLLWDLVAKCSRSSDVVLQGTGAESRDFIHARDVARAIYMAANDEGLVGQTINVASGRETTVMEVAKMIAARFSDIQLSFDGQVPLGVPSRWQACTRKLASLGFRIKHPLVDAIDDYVNWAKPLVHV